MTWRAYLAETSSGLAYRSLEVDSFTWEDEVNRIAGGRAVIRKESLKGLARHQYDVIQASLVLCYVRPDGTEVPWVGGPITGRPTETRRALTVEWSGMRHMMARRLALREGAVAEAQATLQALISTRKAAEVAKATVKTRDKAYSDAKTTAWEALKAARDAAGTTKTTGNSYIQNNTPPGGKNYFWIRTTDNMPHVWGTSSYVAKTTTAARNAANTAVTRRDQREAAEVALATAKTDEAQKNAAAEALEADTQYDFNVRFSNATLGGIAWSLINLAQMKPGGRLPIVRGTPHETGTETRTYHWWDLANLNVDKLLTELSEADNGPDIHFRPRWADAGHTRFEWEVVHGTRAQPTIAQRWTPDWDASAEKSDVIDIEIANDASAVADRLYATGAGQGAGTLISQATNLARVQSGRPFLETVISDSNQKSITTLAQRARGRLSAGREPFDQLSIEVRANSTKNPLGEWRVGDGAMITLADEWVHIPAGTYLMRMIKASGSLSENVTIEMQEDQWYPTGT